MELVYSEYVLSKVLQWRWILLLVNFDKIRSILTLTLSKANEFCGHTVCGGPMCWCVQYCRPCLIRSTKAQMTYILYTGIINSLLTYLWFSGPCGILMPVPVCFLSWRCWWTANMTSEWLSPVLVCLRASILRLPVAVLTGLLRKTFSLIMLGMIWTLSWAPFFATSSQFEFVVSSSSEFPNWY